RRRGRPEVGHGASGDGPLSVTERHGAGASNSTAYDDTGAGRTSEAAHGHGTGDEADSHNHTSRQDGGSKDGVDPHTQTDRIGALVVVMALAFSAVVVRLVFVQGLSSARYANFGASQRLRSVDIPAERGAIFDRNHVELAMTIRQRTVWANPQLVRDPIADA